MKYKKLYYVKLLIYSLIFILFTAVKWQNMTMNSYSISYLLKYDHVFDICISLSVIGFFYHRFYKNELVKSRLFANGLKEHEKYICSETFKISLIWCFLLFLYDFNKYEWNKWVVVLSIFLMIISSVYVFMCLHFILIRKYSKYSWIFIIEFLVLVFYRFIFLSLFNLVNYNVSVNRYSTNLLLTGFNAFLIAGMLYFMNDKKHLKMIPTMKKSSLPLGYLIMEFFSLLMIQSYMEKKYSYSFFDLFFLTSGEKFTAFLFWLLPKVVILFAAYRRITSTYQHNLIFYITRIDDRSRWVRRLVGSNVKDAFLFTLIKSLVTVFLFGWNMQIITSGVAYMLYVMLMMSCVDIVYLVLKREETLNYLIMGYLIMCMLAVYGGMGMLSWMMLDVKKWTNFIILGSCLLLHFITVQLLKRDEYYV
ncbi:hypothetical protein SAMN05216514_11081 [Kandleria vitulina]|uniref:hypothetical protein n=1 Tax=Kandleria vitulina TaxID=1630 RepID=UPI0008CAD137|nr:hypothetical protein [Kandleria vitulina]SEJ10393.1 hypothetical protein SAMN05216514_11081 [Kandleria vitulina]